MAFHSFYITSCFVIFSVLTISLQESPKSQPKASFLVHFSSCLIKIRANFDNSDSDISRREKSLYLSYFGEKTPIIIDSDFSNSDLCSQVTADSELINKTSERRQCHPDGIRRKRVECYAQIYFTENILGEKGDFLSLHKILEDVVAQNEDPNYIIFIRSNGKEESPDFRRSESGFYSNLYRLTLTSTFIVIDAKRKKVKMVCLHCRGSIENQLEIIPTSEIDSRSDVDEMWLRIHKNMLGRSVEALKYRTDEINQYEALGCGLYKVGLKTDPNICGILAISKALNVTPFATDYKIYGHIKFGMMSYADYNEQVFLTPSSSKYEWSTAAEHFEPFVYITVVDKASLNISALWRTFDPSTWGMLVSTFIGLATLFAATTSSRYEVMRTRLINLRFTFVLFTAILLEQSQLTIWKVKMRLNTVSKVIIITWIFAAIIISSLYRGTIFSYLTTSVPPPIPGTTKDLVESSYFLVTTTSYHYQGKPYSTLVGILNEMMVGKPGVDFPLFYKELAENVHFIPASHAQIVKAHCAGTPLLAVSSHNNRHDRHSTPSSPGTRKKPGQDPKIQATQNHLHIFQNVSVPDNFAIIGSQFDVDTLKKLMETFATAFVQKSSTVHTFLNRTPWVIRRNFFLRLFQPALAHLYESGLYTRWRKYSEILHVSGEFLNVHELVKKEEPPHNYLALLFSGLNTQENHSLTPKPLSFEVFDSAFVFYILCTTGSIAVFMTEWFFFIFSKFVLNIERKNMVGTARI